jgi:hypothetical protein
LNAFKRPERTGDMAPLIEHLHSKCKALSSNPIPPKKKERKKEKENSPPVLTQKVLALQ